MKNKNKYVYSGVGILVAVFVFVGGFFVGTYGVVSFGQSEVSAETPASLNDFWKVWNLIDKKFVSSNKDDVASTEDRVYGAISGMVDSLGDPYTVFLPPQEKEDLEESIRGNFEGVGMEISQEDGLIVVVSPLKNSPAYKAGLKSGDIIIQIDGVTTNNINIDDAVDRIRGEKGTTVELTVARQGESEPLKFKIKRDVIQIPTIDYELNKDNIFVISLYNFSAQAPQAMREALRQFVLSNTNKLILDLRGNPGGFLDSAIDVASWFLPAGKVVVIEDFGGNQAEKVLRSKGYDLFNKNLEMVVLIDGGSASASEIVAGALKDHKVATLMGKDSFGKGSVQELIEISDKTSLKVTVAQWLTPDGISISDGGLTPDIEVDQSEDPESKIDRQLEQAIQYLKSK